MIQPISIEQFLIHHLNYGTERAKHKSHTTPAIVILISIFFILTNHKLNFNSQDLLREIETLETPYQETVAASQYVLSYLNGTLQKSASQSIEKKLNDLKTHYEA